MNNKYQFTLPKKAENLYTIRLTTSSIASLRDFTIEQIEDLKICISEACNIAIKHSENKELELEYILLEDGIEISLNNLEVNQEYVENQELSRIILQALIDDVEINQSHIRMRLFI